MEMQKPKRRPDENNNAKEERITFSVGKKSLIRWVVIAAAAAAALLVVFLVVLPAVRQGQPPQGGAKPQATTLQFTTEEMDVTGVDLKGKVVIVDAGHGGDDLGSLAAGSGKPEKEINLEVANRVKAKLEEEGAAVVMTRTTGDALGPTKEDDFVARETIIRQSDADAFISIHMNEYESRNASGPQVFFLRQGAVGKRLATSIQDMLNYTLQVESPRMALPAEYRILKTGAQPSCTVECGFLSNPDEGALLQTEEYQQKLAACIVDGTKLYFKRYADLIAQEEREKEAAASAAAQTASAAPAGPSASAASAVPAASQTAPATASAPADRQPAASG